MNEQTRLILRDTINELKKSAQPLTDKEYIYLMGSLGDYTKAAEELARLGQRATS